MYGEFVSYMHLWLYFMFVRPAFDMIRVWVTATYFLKLFFPHCDAPEPAIKLLAVFCMGKLK